MVQQPQVCMQPFDELTRGAIAATLNIISTFPLHKLMFRQQVSGISVRRAVAELWAEGPRLLFRGLAPPILQRASSVGVMFSTYQLYSGVLANSGFGPIAASVCAGGASGLSESFLTPMERIQTILQHKHYNGTVRGTRHCASILAPFGVAEFYRGYSAVLTRCVGTNALFFSLRGPIKDAVLNALEAPTASRGQVVQPSTRTAYSSPLHMRTYEYRRPAPHPSQGGADCTDMPYLHRSGGGGAVNMLQLARTHTRTALLAADFVSGCLLGALIGFAFYPISTAKSLMQLPIGKAHFPSILETLRDVHREKGFSGMMAGSSTNVVRSMLSWGIMNAAYELMTPSALGYPSQWVSGSWNHVVPFRETHKQHPVAQPVVERGQVRARVPDAAVDLNVCPRTDEATPEPEAMSEDVQADVEPVYTWESEAGKETVSDQYLREWIDEHNRRVLRGRWKNAMRIAQSQFW